MTSDGGSLHLASRLHLNPEVAVKLPWTQGSDGPSSNVELHIRLDPFLALSVYWDPKGGTFGGSNLEAKELCL